MFPVQVFPSQIFSPQVFPPSLQVLVPIAVVNLPKVQKVGSISVFWDADTKRTVIILENELDVSVASISSPGLHGQSIP